jgi:hypothetical protein
VAVALQEGGGVGGSGIWPVAPCAVQQPMSSATLPLRTPPQSMMALMSAPLAEKIPGPSP